MAHKSNEIADIVNSREARDVFRLCALCFGDVMAATHLRLCTFNVECLKHNFRFKLGCEGSAFAFRQWSKFRVAVQRRPPALLCSRPSDS